MNMFGVCMCASITLHPRAETSGNLAGTSIIWV